MAKAKEGDKVKIHYTGKFEDGQVFDSSVDREPLEFTLGQGQVIPGFEKGVVGMEEGEKKEITVTPEEGYGPRYDQNVIEVKKSVFPDDITPEVGRQLQVQAPDGNKMNVVITEVQDETVTLDANHPLAGKTLLFDVELVEIAA
ncbi:MAG TPA: peptidylprolyl isomerase [candidate division Zixibacteria bacterium]|nr:peptidylprolyl isomerase [candidate division Zixibacteria bacterium]